MDVWFNDIKVSAVDTGNGAGFFYAQSEDKDALDEVAEVTGKIPEVKEVTVEWVTEQTYTRTDGTVRTIGGYWKMIATF